MKRNTMIVAGAAALALTLVGGGAAVALGEDEAEGPDVAITGSALEEASAAALAHTGGGRVTDTEVGDEEGYYEVEVTLDSGKQVDVHLDESFAVLGAEDEGADEGEDEG